MMDEYTLASKIFGSNRSEAGKQSRNISMVTGTAVEDSSNGLVKVDIGGNVTGDEPYVYVPTGPSVKAGDTVQVQLAGPVAKTPFVANVAGWGDRIASVAEQAEAVAEEAKEAAEGAGTQYFWQNDSDAETYGGAGVHVTNDRKDDWVEAVADDFSDLSDNHPYHNILINSLGILLRRALNNLVTITRNAIAFYDGEGNAASNVVATFGASGAQIGKSTSQHAVVDANGLAVYNGDGTIARVNSVDVVAVKTASDEASTLLDGMKNAAQAAGTTLNGIYADAETAKSSAATASAAAATASADASAARTMAEGASADAAIAKQSADKATFALSDVENVVGTLNWIAEHGGYVLTSDTAIVDGKAYYTRSGTAPDYVYTVVASPDASELSTYYELELDESVQNYLASHLWLDNYGLNLSVDSANGYRIHQGTVDGTKVAGTYIIDPQGTIVASFGAGGFQVGLDDESNLIGDYHSLQLIDKEGNAYFHVSDLRDKSGTALVPVYFIGNGSDSRFSYGSVSLQGTVEDVTVNGASVTYTDDTDGKKVELDTVPRSGSTVIIWFSTDDPMAKAYTMGTRAVGSSVGAMSYVHGVGNAASGWASEATGIQTMATNDGSHAEGLSTKAFEDGAHAEGGMSLAYGKYSHAEGRETLVDITGFAAHAEGSQTRAASPSSHAEGGFCQTTSMYAHAEGESSLASGRASHAEGNHAIASSPYSHAQNYYTKASSPSQTALGRFNVEDANGDYAVIVGNGTSDSARSNALTVDWDGSVEAAGEVSATDSNDVVHNLTEKADRSDMDTALAGKVSKSGDTMTGALTVDGEVTATDANDVAHNLTEKVSKSGDTMTGSLSFINDEIDRDAAAPSSKQYGQKMPLWRDADGELIGYIQAVRQTDGRIGMQITPINEKSDGTNAYGGMTLYVDSAGTTSYGVADPANFRSAISALGAASDGTYYGMLTPAGASDQWIRTTSSGIIPYQAGGSSALGMTSWPFNNVFSRTISTRHASLKQSTAPSATTHHQASHIYDADGNEIGHDEYSLNTARAITHNFAAVRQKKDDSTWTWYQCSMTVAVNGTVSYSINSPAAFRNAISAVPKRTQLYNNTTGSAGTITLSQTAANFNHIRVYYRAGDDQLKPANSVDIYSPDGKSFSLWTVYTDNAKGFTVRGSTKYLSGKTLGVRGQGGVGWLGDGSWAGASGATSNNIYIVRVEGWNE